MIELVKLEKELSEAWPMSCEGTKAKWLVIQQTIACLNKVAEIRKHTDEESSFVSDYHALRETYDIGVFVDIENGKYESKYLPLALCDRLFDLYSRIQHT